MAKHLLVILILVLTQTLVAQTTDFTYSTGSNACLPTDIHFTQTSSGTPRGYLWDFGNGKRSNDANPTAIYDEAGSYTVKLITVYNNSTAQRTHTVTVHPYITGNFTADRMITCQPGVINFSAEGSAQLLNYVWEFGDSTALVTTTSTTISHTYSGYGEFPVTLITTSTTGCSVTSERTVKIIEPRISGTVSNVTGCIPVTTNFTSSIDLMPGSSVTNQTWSFGDGQTSNSESYQISHTYTTSGAFSPTLTITTNEGCTKIFRFDSLFFGTPPTNSAAHSDDSVYCGSETPLFFSTATNANRYDWKFGSNTITSVTETTTQHRFTSLGVKNIIVTPYYNGCQGTPVSFSLKIIGVIAKYNYNNTCSDKKTFEFHNTSLGNVSTLNWTSVGQSVSSNPDVTFTYPQNGTTDVKLLITDNITGCVDSLITKIYTANPILSNPATSICINTDTRFSVLQNYENPDLAYTWDLLGKEIGPGTDDTITVHADTLGHFNSAVVLDNGPHYCPDTIHLDHIITVRGPQLDFTAPTSVCLNTPVSVVNLSHPFQPADSVNLWYWNFGERFATNDTIFQPAPHTYTTVKAFKIKLTAVDIYGCMDTLVKKVFVRPIPFLWIIPRTVTLCQGQSTTLIGYTSDPILWAPAASNSCTTCDTTTVNPLETTTYYATATNSFNCAASDSAVVYITKAFTANAITPDSYICAGEKIKLEVEPKDKIITWTPAEGLSNSNVFDPLAAPVQTTTYTATLTDSAGCFTSTADIKVTVKSKPFVDAGPDKIYPYNSNITFNPKYSSNIRTWLWTPADSLSCSTCPSPSCNATGSKTYTITVVSDSGCIAKDDINITVDSKILLPTAFTPNNDNLNDLFHPLTHGIKVISRFSIFNRQGQLVYELRNFTPNKEKYGWDGKFQGRDQESAAYVYIAEGISDVGVTVVSKGSFLLIR